MRNRSKHLWQITRWGWFVTYELGWLFIYVNVDVVVGKYGSEKAKYIGERVMSKTTESLFPEKTLFPLS
jgi:hypothetical protein